MTEPDAPWASEDPAAVAIHRRHHHLLDAFRSLVSDIGPPKRFGRDGAALRAVVALLREGLGPYAQQEEQRLPPGHVRETTAFEHAFLQVEVDSLARLIMRPPETPGRDSDIARSLHRIGAVLELHVERSNDDTAGFPDVTPRGRSLGDPQRSSF